MLFGFFSMWTIQTAWLSSFCKPEIARCLAFYKKWAYIQLAAAAISFTGLVVLIYKAVKVLRTDK